MTAPRSHLQNGSVINASNQVISKQPARLEPVLPSLGKLDARLRSIFLGGCQRRATSVCIPSNLPAPERKNIGSGSPFSIQGSRSSYRDHDAIGQVRFSPPFILLAFLGNQRTLILPILAHPKANHPGA